MNIALIIAGGTGHRMKNEVPKQFLNVNDKPVIIYTLEAFQTHPDIDKIGVVCVDGWHDILKAYARQYRIDKLDWVVSGGENGQASIRSGVFEAEKRYGGDDIILVHDAIRPMVSQEIISDCIVQCREHGSAVVVTPCNTVVLRRTTGESSKEGENGQASIRSGVFEAEKRYGGDDIILVHDAIRPMVSQEIISDCIVQCREHGSAVVVTPCNTVVLRRTTGESSKEVVPRDQLAVTQTPQAFPIRKLADAHRRALELGITNAIASCSMMVELGETVHFSIGAETNIKLTTPDDLKIFKALLALRDTGKDPWLR